MLSFEDFRERLEHLRSQGKADADIVQFSGGEPTVHPDLERMMELCLERGMKKVYVNTNGIRLATDPDLVQRWSKIDGGRDRVQVYLQFDGFEEETYASLRGARGLWPLKRMAIERALAHDLFVMPVMTVTRDVNLHEVGAVLQMVREQHPRMTTLMLQPAFYSGRYDHERGLHLSMSEVAEEVARQSRGLFSLDDFGPIPCSHPNCFAMAVALMRDGVATPISRYFPRFETWDRPGVRDVRVPSLGPPPPTPIGGDRGRRRHRIPPRSAHPGRRLGELGGLPQLPGGGHQTVHGRTHVRSGPRRPLLRPHRRPLRCTCVVLRVQRGPPSARPPVRVHVVGGFLGAGKTTLVRAAAHRLTRRGERVGIVTNDQGASLVDTRLCSGPSTTVREIDGGCFCCRYDALGDALHGLRNAGATVVLAEAVGSCTDLVATVLSPLVAREPWLEVAPLTVVVDPGRMADAEADRLPADVTYLFRKQIEEADVIVLTRGDLKVPDVEEVVAALNPRAPVLKVSGRSGEGAEEWLRAMPADLAPPLAIDYDRYARAEADLGWANATIHIRGQRPLDPTETIRRFLAALVDAPVVHVKVATLHPEGGSASLVRRGEAPSLETEALPPRAGSLRMIVNRPRCAPARRPRVAAPWRCRPRGRGRACDLGRLRVLPARAPRATPP